MSTEKHLSMRFDEFVGGEIAKLLSVSDCSSFMQMMTHFKQGSTSGVHESGLYRSVEEKSKTFERIIAGEICVHTRNFEEMVLSKACDVEEIETLYDMVCLANELYNDWSAAELYESNGASFNLWRSQQFLYRYLRYNVDTGNNSKIPEGWTKEELIAHEQMYQRKIATKPHKDNEEYMLFSHFSSDYSFEQHLKSLIGDIKLRLSQIRYNELLLACIDSEHPLELVDADETYDTVKALCCGYDD